MARLRQRLDADPENGMAPCHSMILTPEAVKSRFIIYTQTLEKFAQADDHNHDIRSIAKRWPRRSISREYEQELRVTRRIKLDQETGRRRSLAKIIVCSSVGPTDFSFQLHKMSEGLQALEGQMKVFYDDPESNHRDPNYVVATGIFQGSYYAAFSRRRRQWVRCLCHTDHPVIKRDSLAVVTLIDYGCNETVSGNQFRPLLPSFCTLPAQGYTGSLMDSPTTGDIANGEFSPQALYDFREKVIGKTFYAYFCHVNSPNPMSDRKPAVPDATMYLATSDRKIIAFRDDGAGRQIVYEMTAVHDLMNIF